MEDPRLRFRRRKPPERQSTTSTLQNATLITLTALKESSDAFPPLKSTVGGVVHIWELCRKVKSNQAECLALWSRVMEILNMIADAVPDGTRIPPDLLVRIENFTCVLDDIQTFMESLRHRKYLNRLLRHKEDEGRLNDLNRQLDDAFRSFSLISSMKIEMIVSSLEESGKALGNRLDVLSDSVKCGHEDAMALIRQKDHQFQKQLMLLVLFD